MQLFEDHLIPRQSPRLVREQVRHPPQLLRDRRGPGDRARGVAVPLDGNSIGLKNRQKNGPKRILEKDMCTLLGVPSFRIR